MFSSKVELSEFKPINSLWTDFSKIHGKEKAYKAICQAIDVQNMNGKKETLPVLFFETCGVCLISIESVREQTGLSLHGKRQVLVISIKNRFFQLLQKPEQ